MGASRFCNRLTFFVSFVFFAAWRFHADTKLTFFVTYCPHFVNVFINVDKRFAFLITVVLFKRFKIFILIFKDFVFRTNKRTIEQSLTHG